MSKRSIIALKFLLHLLCLAPFAYLLHLYRNGALALNPDPVNYITHFTGDWTLYILLATLAITPLRRLSPRISFLVRFRRLIGLYAFFYATLHLATYIFLFSGYDIATALSAASAQAIPARSSPNGRSSGPPSSTTCSSAASSRLAFFAWFILFAARRYFAGLHHAGHGRKKLAATASPDLRRRHRRSHSLLVARQSWRPHAVEGHRSSSPAASGPNRLLHLEAQTTIGSRSADPRRSYE